MKNKRLYLPLPVVSLLIMMVPALAAQEQNSTPSASEQRAMTILKNMREYLARTERFSVTIRDGYDAVQQSGQKLEYGEVRKVTVSRPDQLRFEIERSDGEKGLVLFNGKDIAPESPLARKRMRYSLSIRWISCPVHGKDHRELKGT